MGEAFLGAGNVHQVKDDDAFGCPAPKKVAKLLVCSLIKIGHFFWRGTVRLSIELHIRRAGFKVITLGPSFPHPDITILQQKRLDQVWLL